MEVTKIALSTFLITLLLAGLYFIMGLSNIIDFERSKEILLETSTDDMILILWDNCLNSTLFSVTQNEISYLENHECSVMKCMSDLNIPYFFEIYIKKDRGSAEKIKFGICPVDQKYCLNKRYKVIVAEGYLADMDAYICYDDLSRLTIMLDRHCKNKKSFIIRFSEIRNLEANNEKICVDGLCNNIQCEFMQNIKILDARELYFKYDEKNLRYNVIKVE